MLNTHEEDYAEYYAEKKKFSVYFISWHEIIRILSHETNSECFLFHETGGIPTKQPSVSSSLVFRGIDFFTKIVNSTYSQRNLPLYRQPVLEQADQYIRCRYVDCA